MIANPQSQTGAYLSGRKFIPIPERRRDAARLARRQERRARTTCAASTCDFPIGAFTCVTGVSGSGKSTLVNQVFVQALNQHLHRQPAGGTYGTVKGADAARQDGRDRSIADRPHAAHRIRQPIPARSIRFASCFRWCPKRRCAATRRDGFRSTSRAAAARRARATASSRSRCTSCPTSTCRAKSARASATTRRRSK